MGGRACSYTKSLAHTTGHVETGNKQTFPKLQVRVAGSRARWAENWVIWFYNRRPSAVMSITMDPLNFCRCWLGFIWVSWCSQLCNFPPSSLRLGSFDSTEKIDWTQLTCKHFPFTVGKRFIYPATHPTNCDLFSFLPKLIHQKHGSTSNGRRGGDLILDLRPFLVHAWGNFWQTEFTGKCFQKPYAPPFVFDRGEPAKQKKIHPFFFDDGA